MPDIFNFALLNHSMTEVAGLPVINLTESPLSGVNRVIKAAEDFVLSRCSSSRIAAHAADRRRREAFFARSGVLCPGARDVERPPFQDEEIPHDAGGRGGGYRPGVGHSRRTRATPFGAFLRRSSLDELPQLLNVLTRRHVARRPAARAARIRRQFRTRFPATCRSTGEGRNHRLGAGQRSARRHRPGAPHRFDLYYIDNWSLLFDLRILALTVVHLIRTRNAY